MLDLPAFVNERELLDAVGEAVVVTTTEGVVVYWNAFAETLYGWTVGEALGTPVSELTVPVDGALEAEAITNEMLATGKWSGDFRVRHKDGSNFVAYVTLTPVVNADGTVAGIVGVSHDVTDRLNIERELRSTAERLQLALEAGRMGTWTWVPGSDLVTWDAAMEALYGLEPGTFSGTFAEFLERMHPDDRHRVGSGIGASVRGEAPLVHEHRAVWPDGSEHWLEGRGHVVRDAHGNVIGMIGVGIDIDERKRRERLLAEYEADVQRMYRRLQTGLLPAFELDDRVVVESLYRPGEARLLLGGDFYDAVSRADGSLVLVVGDVSGQGPDAAALGARLRAAWRALALRSDDHAEVVATLDQLLRHEAPEAEMFATIAYVTVSADQRDANVTLAGHPPPLVVTHGRADAVEVAPNRPLGMIAGPIASTEVELGDSWSLLLFTDGIIEGRVRPDASERYGERRLADDAAELVTGTRPGVLEDLVQRAETANGGPLRDDVALILVSPHRG